ncbi:MAG: C69 family dipeptidase [Faecalibacillus faecis]
MHAIFGSHDDSDHIYNTPRAWIIEKYLNPHTFDHHPEDDDIPWSLKPEKKITIEDVKYVLSSHFQGTDYDPYKNHGDLSKKGMYRPIGINRNDFVSVIQLRPYMPQEFQAIEWIAYASNVFNTIVPFYGNITQTPDYLSNTTETVSTDNFYWSIV